MCQRLCKESGVFGEFRMIWGVWVSTENLDESLCCGTECSETVQMYGSIMLMGMRRLMEGGSCTAMAEH